MSKDPFSKAERINKQAAMSKAQAERLNNAKKIFKAIAEEYLKQETNISRMGVAINMLDELTKGAKALHTMERRGITNFE